LASDKLFYMLLHSNPDLILRWLEDLPADAGGHSFSAPVLKEREYRLDGLFSPSLQRPDLPAVVLEAQMAPDPGFLLRLYAETGRFLLSDALHQQACTDPVAAEVLQLIPTILVTRFRDKTIPEICAMGGLTLEDFTQSRAYKEIFGLGEANLALRQLARRCGPLSEATTARIQALPLEQLEALAVGAAFSEGVALLDFNGPDGLNTWLAANA